MVIKDENGKVVILMSKRDILEYVFEKCGFEVGIEVEDVFKTAENAPDYDECDGCSDLSEAEERAEKLQFRVDSLEFDLEDLNEQFDELQDKFENQKKSYIKYLKNKHYYSAAKALEQMDEED